MQPSLGELRVEALQELNQSLALLTGFLALAEQAAEARLMDQVAERLQLAGQAARRAVSSTNLLMGSEAECPGGLAESAETASESAGACGLRILLVEDSTTLRELIAIILRTAEHQVDAVGSAREALAHLARASYDLVISDLSLGAAMNGLELAQSVRQMLPDLAFILVTGSVDELSPQEAAWAGVDAVLRKPFGTAELRQIVCRVAGPASRAG